MKMLKELGLSRFAYNGSGAVDAEIEAAKKHGIEIAAWWYPARDPKIVESTKRHGIHPQFWVCGSRAITATNDAERIEAEAARIRPIAEDAAAMSPAFGVMAPAKATPPVQESERISATAAIRFMGCPCSTFICGGSTDPLQALPPVTRPLNRGTMRRCRE